MRKIGQVLKRYWSLEILVGVWGWVAWKSFQPGTWLLGWDNLVPELNFGLEFKRLLWGVWQEYRGVGVLGGMAHIADLPRVVILWLLHWVVPTIYLRWLWHLGMLLLGPVGVWWLAFSLLPLASSLLLRNLVGLVGGLFYLLNPATLQYFYTPFETFSSFYGFFPWLVGLAILYLKTGKKKFLKWLGVVSLLGTSAFYVQTLFVVYGLVLGVWLLVFSLKGKKYGKRGLKVLGTVAVVNAFWLLPVAYFTLTNSGVTKVNHINSIATPETVLMNQAFGGWRDVLGLRGYWLEYGDWKGGKYTRLMDGGWYEWLMKPEVKLVATGMGILAFSFLLLAFGFWVRFWFQNRLSRQAGINSTTMTLILDLGLLGTIMMAWVMLGSYNPPFGWLYRWLVEHVPLFGEIFRSVFTKWSVVMAWGMAMGVSCIMYHVSWILKKREVLVGVALGLMMAVGYVMWPAFSQGVIYDRMKVKLPEAYLEMFAYFKRAPMGRVAYFPVQTFWGWDFLRWGYRGSGFLWYGMEQPTLHRSFDVWSPDNEGFYNQISRAIYGCDSGKYQVSSIKYQGDDKLDLKSVSSLSSCVSWVGKVLGKYDVRYVLLDRSVFEPGKSERVLRIPEIERVMDRLGKRVFESSEKLEVRGEKEEPMLTVWELKKKNNDWIEVLPEYHRLANEVDVKADQDVVFGEGFSTILENPRFLGGVRDDKSGLESAPALSGHYVEMEAEGDEWSPFAQLSYGTTSKISDERRVTGDEGPRGFPERVGWIVIKGAPFLGKEAEFDPRYKIQDTRYDLWPGTVLARRRGDKLEVRVAVGIPGIALGNVASSLRPLAFSLEPEWIEETVDLKENSEKKIDYVFLNKKWYGVSGVGKDWERVGYFPVKLGEEVVIKGAKRSLVAGKDVFTELVDKSAFSLKPLAFSLEKLDKLELERGEYLEIWYPFWDDNDLKRHGNKVAKNCDALGRGEVSLKPLASSLLYRAKGYGVNCDYIPYERYGGFEDYFLVIKGENVAGRGLKVYMHTLDEEGRTLLEELVPSFPPSNWLRKNGRSPASAGAALALTAGESPKATPARRLFREVFLSLNLKGEKDVQKPFEAIYRINGVKSGMVLNLETRSFGRVASENVVEKVELIPARLQPLLELRVSDQRRATGDRPARSFAAMVGRRRVTNNLTNLRYKKLGAGFYIVPLGRDGFQGSGFGFRDDQPVLTLSQGYEKGWIGVLVRSKKLEVRGLKFKIWKIKKLKHVRVDGWKNGWVVPLGRDGFQGSGFSNQKNPITDHRSLITIFYWPQVLEWVGLLCILYFVSCILVKNGRACG